MTDCGASAPHHRLRGSSHGHHAASTRRSFLWEYHFEPKTFGTISSCSGRAFNILSIAPKHDSESRFFRSRGTKSTVTAYRGLTRQTDSVHESAVRRKARPPAANGFSALAPTGRLVLVVVNAPKRRYFGREIG